MTEGYTVVNGKERIFSREDFSDLLKDVLAKDSLFRFKAKGASMFPFIRDGDVLTLERVHSRVSPGEVVAFISDCSGALSIHRVVAIDKGKCLLRGDNTPAADGLVAEKELLGRVNCVEREGRGVRLGMGREKRLIALLSHRGWLMPLTRTTRVFLRPFRGMKHGEQ